MAGPVRWSDLHPARRGRRRPDCGSGQACAVPLGYEDVREVEKLTSPWPAAGAAQDLGAVPTPCRFPSCAVRTSPAPSLGRRPSCPTSRFVRAVPPPWSRAQRGPAPSAAACRLPMHRGQGAGQRRSCRLSTSWVTPRPGKRVTGTPSPLFLTTDVIPVFAFLECRVRARRQQARRSGLGEDRLTSVSAAV